MNKALFKDLCPTSSHCTHCAVELSPCYSFTMTQLLTALSTERTLPKTWQCGPRQSQTRLPKPRPVLGNPGQLIPSGEARLVRNKIQEP